MALPLGEAGVRMMAPAAEDAVLAAMKSAMTERGLYIFPGMDMAKATEEEQKAWPAKYAAGPPGSVGFLRRALLVALLGLLEAFDIDVSQWNWYSFPTPYMLAQLVDHTVGWFLAGLVLARVCRDRA